MNTLKKVLIGSMLGLAVINIPCCSVNAATKKVTGVTVSKSAKSKKVTVKLKKVKGAKRYKIRYYIVNTKGVKSTKAKTKIVKANKFKKSGSKIYYKFNLSSKKQNVVVDVTYSKKNSGNNFISTYSTQTCSKHKYITKTSTTTTKEVDMSKIIGYEPKVKSKEEEWKCLGCGLTGTGTELSTHMNNYTIKFEECQEEIFNYVAKKYNVSIDTIYNTISSVNTNIGQDETADKYMKACLEWMNKNTEFKCYYGDNTSIFGCIQDCTTGKYITTYEDDLTKPIYGEKEVTTTKKYKECANCGHTK